MISLTARIRPAHEAGSHLVRLVGARLRAFDHVSCSTGQLLVLVPGLGSALVTETRWEIVVNLAMDSEDAAARACASLLREVATAVGNRAPYNHLAIAWSREEFVPAALR